MFMFSYSYSCSVLYPDLGFSVLFFSCKENSRVYLAKTGHGPHSFLIVLFHVLIVLLYILFCVDCVVHVLFVCKCVLLPPGVNPIAVKYIISYIITYRIISYHTIPYHIIPYHTIYHIIPYHISYHTIPYHMSYHIISRTQQDIATNVQTSSCKLFVFLIRF